VQSDEIFTVDYSQTDTNCYSDSTSVSDAHCSHDGHDARRIWHWEGDAYLS